MPNRPPRKPGRGTARKPWQRTAAEQHTHNVRYGRPWRSLRDAFIRVNPICVDPFNRHPDIVVGAEEVDHVQPLEHGGELLDWDNLRSLCVACHREATARMKKG